jgi:hypothetical protein
MAAILLIFEWLNYGKVNELEKMAQDVVEYLGDHPSVPKPGQEGRLSNIIHT